MNALAANSSFNNLVLSTPSLAICAASCSARSSITHAWSNIARPAASVTSFSSVISRQRSRPCRPRSRGGPSGLDEFQFRWHLGTASSSRDRTSASPRSRAPSMAASLYLRLHGLVLLRHLRLRSTMAGSGNLHSLSCLPFRLLNVLTGLPSVRLCTCGLPLLPRVVWAVAPRRTQRPLSILIQR